MKLSKIQQIIKEEVAKAISEVNDEYGTAMDNFNKAVGIEPTAGGPENKTNPIELPSLTSGDVYTTYRNMDAVNKWIEDFKAKYGEDPKLAKTKIPGRFKVTNPEYVAWRDKYISGKSSELDKYKNID